MNILTKQTRFILAIALQTIIIFAIIIFKVSILSGGTDILLRIEPIDPRSPLRGDYITFQYSSISSFVPYTLKEQRIENGDTVYVMLYQTGKYWTGQNVQRTKPLGEEIFLKGKVVSGGVETQSGGFSNQRFSGSSLHIVYGIEEYFIPEKQGQGFSFWNKEVAARVAVDENGNSVLKQIYVDDKPWP